MGNSEIRIMRSNTSHGTVSQKIHHIFEALTQMIQHFIQDA